MQQLLINNQDSLYQEFRDKLLSQSESMIIYDRFRIGCELDSQWKYTFSMYKALDYNNCIISDYVKEKIAGEDCQKKEKKICNLIKEHHQEIEQTCFINNPAW